MTLLDLPNELLLYIFTHFIDLKDLWCLYQTNSELRYFASTIIKSKWKIDTTTPENRILKIQCRTSLIVLSDLAIHYNNNHRNNVTIKDHSNKLSTVAMIHYLTVENTKEEEEKLHLNIIKGISSYKHKYVLIQDIDIRNRIRTTVDVVFHHAVFVSAIYRKQTTTHVVHRALAAVLVRLLTRLDMAFPSYCREITYTLADNIKAFLEYTGYKILTGHSLDLTLHSISALFDLMGAAFIGKILSDSHIDCAIQRTLELLQNQNNSFKKILLVNVLDHWLTMKREVGSSELVRYIRLEIEKCTC